MRKMILKLRYRVLYRRMERILADDNNFDVDDCLRTLRKFKHAVAALEWFDKIPTL